MLNQPNWFNESEYADFLAESSLLWEANIPYQKQKYANRKKLFQFRANKARQEGILRQELARDLYRAKAKGIQMGLGEEFKQKLMDNFFDKLMEAKTAIKAEKSRMRPEVNPEDRERDRKREDRRQEKQKNPLSRIIIVKNKKINKVEIITRDDYNSKVHEVIKGKVKNIDKGDVTKTHLQHYSNLENFMSTKTSIKLLGKKIKQKEIKNKKQKSKSSSKQNTPESKDSVQTPLPPPSPRVPKDGKEITDPDSTYPDWDHSVVQFTRAVPEALNSINGTPVSPEYTQILSSSRTLGDALNRFTRELQVTFPQIIGMKFEKPNPVLKSGKVWSKMGIKETSSNANIIGYSNKQSLGFSIKIGEQMSPANRGESGQILNSILSLDKEGKFTTSFATFLDDFFEQLRKKYSMGSMFVPTTKIESMADSIRSRQKMEQEKIKNDQTQFVTACGDLIERFLNEDLNLKSAFLYEALSGNIKFDGKTGSAQVVLSSKKDGSDLAAIPLNSEFINDLANSDRSSLSLSFTTTPNSSQGFFQNLMQKMGSGSVLSESTMDVLFEIQKIKNNISNPLTFMNLFEIQLENASFRSPIVYSDFYTPESDVNNTIIINQGTNQEKEINIPVKNKVFDEYGEEENIIEKGIDQILQEYLLINDYLVDNVNSNKMSLEQAYNYMCEEFGLLEERNYRKEYDNYHAKPKQRANRSKRVLARRKLEKEGRVSKGDGKDVDHKNGDPQDNSDDNLRVLSKSKNRSMNEDHGAGFEGTPELVNKLLQDTPGSNEPFVGTKSISYLESRLDKKLKSKKK